MERTSVHLNVFETANAGFAQAMYEDYLRDPASVAPEWRRLFDSGTVGERPTPASTNGSGAPGARQLTDAPTAPGAVPTGATELKGPAGRLVQNMNESLRIPTATSFRELNVTALDARRRELNAALAASGKPGKVSFTHLVAWALVQGLKRHPTMGHALLERDGTSFRVTPDGINLGLAVDVQRKDGSRGLVVPVLKHAEAMDFAAFHATYEELVDKARTNKLLPDAFQGATVTLTNPGGLGTSASVPRLMAHQGTIIATGAIGYPAAFAATPPDQLKALKVGKVMAMTSTYDHRIIQGAESGEFLRTVESLLQGSDDFFEGVAAGLGVVLGAAPAAAAPLPAIKAAPLAEVPVSGESLGQVAAAMALVKAFRTHGHLAARLDPLGSEPIGDPALDPGPLGLTPENMRTIPAATLRVAVPGATLADALPKLRETYCGTIAYEVEHIASHEERVWLRQAIESGRYRTPLAPEARTALLARLTQVETFEKFLHKAYLGQKRFSIEGVDLLVPMLDLAIDLAAQQGARDIVIGMAHRGRLNVLVHNIGRPYEAIFAEFEGNKPRHDEPDAGTGDVKYHLGADGAVRAANGKTVGVTLSPNPSHLEFTGPVVDGRARARQTQRKGASAEHDPTAALPVVIHGDAAFAGQGVVAETLNLSKLPGYGTGGTVHIITNNQIGFTTDTRDARSTRYASDLAKGFDLPIVHVNADDPEACLSAIRLLMAYREKFRGDVLIDLIGYRRHGHNEGDEPAYTQPVMYAKIKDHPTVRTTYAAALVQAGVLTQAAADQQAEAEYQKLLSVQQAMKAAPAKPKGTDPQVPMVGASEVETALPAEMLLGLNEQLLSWPEDFKANPKLQKQLERRRHVMGPEGGIEWAHAEALALGALLMEGVPIRFTGQDTERGTFSQRHLVLHDAQNGRTLAPIQRLGGALAPLELHNSPLSELATMGFEYGYSAAAPEALVMWEAQFGDFVNGAQVIVDQFLAAGLSKWGLTTRLTLLLPHGYEGQGPEHSSARLERFLQLAAEGNIRVANCTTPAQYFHLLRRQARDTRQRPLVILTPKSLLRLPAATSHLSDLTTGGFQPVLDDVAAAAATRVVLSTGKVYYDLHAGAEKLTTGRPALVRVEQIYPFPESELRAMLARHPGATEVVWAQEEPRNMGAWTFLQERLRAVLPKGATLRYAGRPERASPAEGYPAAHAAEQARIVREALGG
ncbi:MAG TPA: multifunctional oxoglutarate decarboxylase/oxoglutarate dehydrogenase thiamine pyrophosphate-binding subunit/dihydrolipoyllysine-residue succinyltransferase subunit [Gemmatimonadales bacterium]|nr:multifunctional oxoglutarate decarboxylase/oxoglutarate dehydrogenase thiamine pyrophosphate-binding subunit/dihydrolipoyllysine-residue succinyltransferase subunit [Gemmatimonadales bacterium]